MLKKIILLLLIGNITCSMASRGRDITNNRNYSFYRHASNTNPSNIQAQKNRSRRDLKEYQWARDKAKTFKEVGTAAALIGGFVAYGALITWVAMNNHPKPL